MTRTSTLIVRVPPTRSNSPSCSTRRSFGCSSSGSSPISSRKIVAAVGELEAPDLAGKRAGESALLVAEELRFDQLRRQRRAVDLHHRPLAPAALIVDRARDHLLAGPRLALQEHGGRGPRDLRDLLQHPLEARRVARETARESLVHGVPQVGVLPLEAVLEPLDLRHRGRKLDVGTLARDRLHERFADQPEPGDEIVGPNPRSAERAEGERADHALTHAQGDRQVRAHADPPHMLGLGDRLGGQVVGQRPHQDYPAGAQLARVPGQFFAQRGPDRDELHARNCDRAERDHRAVRGEFEERAAVEPEKRDELAQGALDLGLHAIARNVGEADGETP